MCNTQECHFLCVCVCVCVCACASLSLHVTVAEVGSVGEATLGMLHLKHIEGECTPTQDNL